jgi:hypothetical protein
MIPSALVSYYEVSPNPDTSGCMVTGDSGDGVVFHNIDTVSAENCFVGRQAILEAYSTITGHTPAQLKKFDKAVSELAEVTAQLKEARRKLAKWDDFSAKAAEAGLIIQVLE